MLIVNYQKSTINRFQRSMNFLDAFMQESGYNLYFPSVGEKFLTSSQSLATREKRLLIQHLDLSMVDMFWGEYYSTKQYQFHNKYLKSTLDCLLNDMNMAGIKRYGKRKVVRGISILDIFMIENSITQYSIDVGRRFLQCMETVSTLSSDLFSRTYQSTIKRINAYCSGKKPSLRRGAEHEFYCKELEQNLEVLVDRLSENQFKETRTPTNVIIKLDLYMAENNIDHYTPKVGEDFVEYYKNNCLIKSKGKQLIATIAHYNDVIAGNPFKKHHVKLKNQIPDQFRSSYNQYRDECRDSGNSESTLLQKDVSCKMFFNELIRIELYEITGITPSMVIEACANIASCHWNSVRGYLHYCAMHEIIAKDYSLFVPRKMKKMPIPTYYTKEERERLESAPNRDTPIGKRDYAIILIANRLGLRSSDIVNLNISQFSPDKKTIDFEQVKTKMSHSLPLFPEISAAIDEYINNARPESKSTKVFLTSYAPYEPLDHLSVHGILTKNFLLAGIDITKRKHGPHALRSSLATDLVNNGFTYDETKYVLGHYNRKSIHHYAMIDIHNLRTCARKPHPATGKFMLSLKLKEGS